MADRRMLPKTITENDNFVALSAASQALYMHLTLSADDDGFCNQISTAMFRAHAKKKDLDALVNARYLLRFENGVMVIKHWRMGNSIRKDRYVPTVYQEEYQRLTLKDNMAYTLAPSGSELVANLATTRQPDGNQAQPQVRLVKDRVGKDRVGKVNTEDINYTHTAHAHAREDEEDAAFDFFWSAYPRKTGDIKTAYSEYLHALDTGADPNQIIAALKWQAEEWKREGEPQFIPSPEKWLKNRRWEELPRDATSAAGGTNNIFLKIIEEERNGQSRNV